MFLMTWKLNFELDDNSIFLSTSSWACWLETFVSNLPSWTWWYEDDILNYVAIIDLNFVDVIDTYYKTLVE